MKKEKNLIRFLVTDIRRRRKKHDNSKEKNICYTSFDKYNSNFICMYNIHLQLLVQILTALNTSKQYQSSLQSKLKRRK